MYMGEHDTRPLEGQQHFGGVRFLQLTNATLLRISTTTPQLYENLRALSETLPATNMYFVTEGRPEQQGLFIALPNFVPLLDQSSEEAGLFGKELKRELKDRPSPTALKEAYAIAVEQYLAHPDEHMREGILAMQQQLERTIDFQISIIELLSLRPYYIDSEFLLSREQLALTFLEAHEITNILEGSSSKV